MGALPEDEDEDRKQRNSPPIGGGLMGLRSISGQACGIYLDINIRSNREAPITNVTMETAATRTSLKRLTPA